MVQTKKLFGLNEKPRSWNKNAMVQMPNSMVWDISAKLQGLIDKI